MRRLTLCLALLVVPAVFAEEKADTKGVKVTLKGGKSSAVFPSRPSEMKVGPLLMYVWKGDGGKSRLIFSQNETDAIDLTDKAIVREKFEKACDASLRAMKGKLLESKEIKLGKLPGYAFDAELAIGIYRSRVYLTGTRYVQMIVGGSQEFVDGPEAKKFLDSLKIETKAKVEKVTTKDGITSIVFPDSPLDQTVGTAERYCLETNGGVPGYYFNKNDLPSQIDLTNDAVVRKAFENARDAKIRKNKGKLLSSKEIKFGKLPGYTFDAEIAGNVNRTRVYFVKTSFVQIGVLGPKEFVESPEAKKFLDSLRIEE